MNPESAYIAFNLNLTFKVAPLHHGDWNAEKGRFAVHVDGRGSKDPLGLKPVNMEIVEEKHEEHRAAVNCAMADMGYTREGGPAPLDTQVVIESDFFDS